MALDSSKITNLALVMCFVSFVYLHQTSIVGADYGRKTTTFNVSLEVFQPNNVTASSLKIVATDFKVKQTARYDILAVAAMFLPSVCLYKLNMSGSSPDVW